MNRAGRVEIFNRILRSFPLNRLRKKKRLYILVATNKIVVLITAASIRRRVVSVVNAFGADGHAVEQRGREESGDNILKISRHTSLRQFKINVRGSVLIIAFLNICNYIVVKISRTMI